DEDHRPTDQQEFAQQEFAHLAPPLNFPQRALAPCHAAPQRACVQERCRTLADGMEIFLSGMPARPQCCCPESASRRTVRYCPGTRNRIRPVALLLQGDGLDGTTDLSSRVS